MNLFLIKKNLRYLLCARHARGHGIHSPFVYDFIRNVCIDSTKYPEYAIIEKQRKKLLHNSSIISVLDLGAGSFQHNTKQRKISDIAASSLSPKKYAQLLFRIVKYYKSQTILELGTSLGISGSYLANAHNHKQIITLEGAPEIAEIAKKTFAKCNCQNIENTIGNFSDTLPQALQKLKQVDFAFIDGNHQKQSTLDYFEQIYPFCNENTILIFDDICWSEGMYEAWQKIKSDSRISITIDMCKIGIVFFRKGIIKQDFVIRF